MYAIVEIGGKQYRVSKDMKLRVPHIASEPGKQVGFDRILFIDDENGKTTIGNPLVNNMLVNATVIGHERDKKVLIFKKKRRKGHQKKQGHRQGYSIIEINTIGAGSLKKETPVVKAKAKEVKAEAAAPKAVAVAEKKPTAAKKVETKAKPKATVVKAKESTAAKATKPAAKSVAPAKAAAKKKVTSASTAKKPAAKAKKKED